MGLSRQIEFSHSKGQLISKGHFGFFNSPKKRPKNFFPSRLRQKVRFLGELETPKRHFKMKWPLGPRSLFCPWIFFKNAVVLYFKPPKQPLCIANLSGTGTAWARQRFFHGCLFLSGLSHYARISIVKRVRGWAKVHTETRDLIGHGWEEDDKRKSWRNLTKSWLFRLTFLGSTAWTVKKCDTHIAQNFSLSSDIKEIVLGQFSYRGFVGTKILHGCLILEPWCS